MKLLPLLTTITISIKTGFTTTTSPQCMKLTDFEILKYSDKQNYHFSPTDSSTKQQTQMLRLCNKYILQTIQSDNTIKFGDYFTKTNETDKFKKKYCKKSKITNSIKSYKNKSQLDVANLNSDYKKLTKTDLKIFKDFCFDIPKTDDDHSFVTCDYFKPSRFSYNSYFFVAEQQLIGNARQYMNHVCSGKSRISKSFTPYELTCSVRPNVVCIGDRKWKEMANCPRNRLEKTAFFGNQKTALVISVFFGGFGFDRFYLGYYKVGFFKLISLGGLGVWTVLDIIFIASGYLRPNDVVYGVNLTG